jgi:hypothetical protein
MAINQLSTANTFEQWLITTQALVAVANTLTDGNGESFIANTNLIISGSASSLDVKTTGTINELTSNTATIGNVAVTGNVANANITNKLFVGGDTVIYGDLTVSGNITLDEIGFDDMDVAGSIVVGNNLTVLDNTTLNNVSANNISISGALETGELVISSGSGGQLNITGITTLNVANIQVITGGADRQITARAITFSIALG